MQKDKILENRNSDSNQKEEKTVELPAFDFIKINFLSVIFPLYVCLGIFLLFEYFMIFYLAIPLIFHLILLPGVILLLYYIYLLSLIEFAAFWVKKWNKKSAPKQGVFKRILDDFTTEESKMMKYYHKRGFIIKYPMWLSSKSLFPWLINRTLRRIGHNKIGKNVIYCDSYVGLEFTDLEDNVFIYPTTALSSHAVNTIFGKITMLEIKLGKNTTLYPGIIAGPGVLTKKNNVIYPNTVLHKSWRGKPEEFYYQGSPGKPIEIKPYFITKN
ncbi:MAG: hypothetical protein EU535_03505 [Promethearchaeota archaeon]|nr:MAG: hypothetical protein EU535_03505 [Candidatus Lokiarchaeota archaeon]